MMDSKLFSVFSVGKKEGCRMGVHRMGIRSLFEFEKREGDRIWRSL